jgi:hypothetical protein
MHTYRLAITLAMLIVAGSDALAEEARLDRRTENVILITIDGLRWQEVFQGADDALMNKENGGVAHVEALKEAYWRDTGEQRRAQLLPFVWSTIAKEGQLFGNADAGSQAQVTNGKNFSYPGYNEMLTGAVDPGIDSNAKRPNPNVTVLEWLNQDARWRGRIAAFASWDVFPFILNQERSGLFVNAGWEPVPGFEPHGRVDLLNHLMVETARHTEGSRYDSFTFHAALEYFRKNQPRVLYIAFGETDEYAHEGRYDHYLTAAHRADAYMKTLWEEAQTLPQYLGKTSMLVTTDHGRGDAPNGWRNHGVTTAGSEKIWVAVLGPDTPALGERQNVPEVHQSQIASTVAALLGADFRSVAPRAAGPIESVLGQPAQ